MSDLPDLEKRFQLLEGEHKLATEKLNGELSANKELIRRMNEENRYLRQQVAAGSDEAGTRSKAVSSLMDLKSRINVLTDENRKKEKVLLDLQAKLTLTQRGLVNDDNSAQARQVRVLENRIDKAMIKLNEAQSIKKTYESILDRLKDERIGFDNTLVDLENQLKVKQKDYDELVLLLRDATHAKEIAHAELHRFEQAVMEERNQRDREVMEKRLLVQKRIDMNRTLEENRKSKISHEPNIPPIEATSHTDGPLNHPHISRTSKEHHHERDHYEEAYAKLKEVTGCTDVNEIIQKFVSQDETEKDLERQVADQEAKLTELDREYHIVSHQLDDIKFAGNGMLTNRKQALEDIEKHLNESVAKLEQNRARYEKMARIMIDIHSGVNHLVTKLGEIKLDDTESRVLEPAVEVNDDTIEELLNQCELKIQKLVQVCSHMPDEHEETSGTRVDSDVRIRLSKNELGGIHLEDLDDDDENFFALRKSGSVILKEKAKGKLTKFAK